MPNDSKRTYPWTTTLKDKQITLRLMQPVDRDALMGFAKSLPEDDLLFLAVDITKPEALDQWVHDIKTGQIKTVLAEASGKLVGHGTLSHNALQWTRHLGEIVLLLSPDYRSIGLGSLLANELFSIARELGLQKIVARMASEQEGAFHVLEQLGFRAEALLGDFVIDRQGRTHDLIVMSHDITGLTE
ncbi:MAG TPA: GNAT family protein [Blastocatellia bacterium]|nr:GNAT family protein [Blastocatellia bacterium]